MAKKRRDAGHLEIIHSEEDFHCLRSKLLFESLRGVRLGLSSDLDIEKRTFSTRRYLQLNNDQEIEEGRQESELSSLAFDINDMMEGMNASSTLSELLGFPDLLVRLRSQFRQISCSKADCEISSINETFRANLNSLDSKTTSHLFIGRVYSNSKGEDSALQIILWAFREGRQAGLRRFYIDGEIRQFPSFDSALLEEEISQVGNPKLFITLELSYPVGETKNEMETAIRSAVWERQVNKKNLHDLKLYSAVVVNYNNSNFEVQKLFPLTGDSYCLRCNLCVIGNEANKLEQVYLSAEPSFESRKVLESKILGYTESELMRLSIGELVEIIRLKDADFGVSSLWQRLASSALAHCPLIATYKSLSLIDRLVLQLAMIEATGISESSFLLELRSSDYESYKDILNQYFVHLTEKQNVISVGLVDIDATLDHAHFDYLLNLKSLDAEGSVMLVDILGLRERIFDLFGKTKEGRVLAFSSTANFKTREYGCARCAGSGIEEVKLPFSYRVLKLCNVCSGSGCSKQVLSIKAYGLLLLETFNLSFSDFVTVFSVEPDFIASEMENGLQLHGSHLLLNTLMPNLDSKSRFNLGNILINTFN